MLTDERQLFRKLTLDFVVKYASKYESDDRTVKVKYYLVRAT